jgi:predicted metal-dependent peptidase
MQDRYTHILEQWFIMEPPLFGVLCLHELVENHQMACPLRSGRKKLEYNPMIVAEMSDAALEEALRAEAVRILLKHPYERRPDGCSQRSMGLASNLVVGDNYTHPRFRIETPEDMGLKRGMNYEWYAREIERQSDNSSEGQSSAGGQQSSGDGRQDSESGQGGLPSWNEGKQGGKPKVEADDRHRDLAELWDEDDMTVQMINGVISSTKSWGSISGNFAELLTNSLKAKINWRNVFAGFRASIISSKRKLTRMKPNRRTGFENMGSVRQFDTKLLVAVDVSGSISTESLKYFYGVINSAFRYGFKEIDVLQFDCGISSVCNLKKVVKDVAVFGRGGTSFQEPIDYAHEHGYDGLVFLTDGFAPEPRIPDGFKTGILWVCESQSCLDHHKSWMEKSGRTCVMQIG